LSFDLLISHQRSLIEIREKLIRFLFLCFHFVLQKLKKKKKKQFIRIISFSKVLSSLSLTKTQKRLDKS